MQLLIVCSILIAAVALGVSSQATLGPTLMGLAVLLAVFARISQAAQRKAASHTTLTCGACGHVNPRGPATCERCGASLKG